MARTFANPSGIACSPGAVGTLLGGAFTFAAIIRRTSDNDYHAVLSLESAGGGHRGGLWVASGGALQVVSSGFDTSFGFTIPNNVTVFVAVTKAAGDGVTPNGWMYRYDTDAWSTGAGAGGINADGDTITTLRIGNSTNADYWFIGDIGIDAGWSVALADAQIRQLPFSLQAWYASGPTFGHLLDQAATSQNVLDWTGGGANQTALSNTSVATTSVPVFSYGHALLVPHSVPAASGTDLTVADATHGHAAESPTLTQVHVLAPADATHGHTADSPTLTQTHVLSVADSSHAHTAETPSLTQVHVLSAADALHGHVADGATLTQLHVLATADASHSLTSDTPALTQVHVLAPADSIHGHTADNVDLAGGATLAPADATHGHTADEVALTQIHELVVDEASHGHTAEPVTLTGGTTLTVQDAVNAHAAEAPTLTQTHVLSVSRATHAHLADQVALTQLHVLVVADALHAHRADAVTFDSDTIIRPNTGTIVRPFTGTITRP